VNKIKIYNKASIGKEERGRVGSDGGPVLASTAVRAIEARRPPSFRVSALPPTGSMLALPTQSPPFHFQKKTPKKKVDSKKKTAKLTVALGPVCPSVTTSFTNRLYSVVSPLSSGGPSTICPPVSQTRACGPRRPRER
jgi:hypothetical protein